MKVHINKGNTHTHTHTYTHTHLVVGEALEDVNPVIAVDHNKLPVLDLKIVNPKFEMVRLYGHGHRRVGCCAILWVLTIFLPIIRVPWHLNQEEAASMHNETPFRYRPSIY